MRFGVGLLLSGAQLDSAWIGVTIVALAYVWAGLRKIRYDFSRWEIHKPDYAKRSGPHVLLVLPLWWRLENRSAAIGSLTWRTLAVAIDAFTLGLFIDEMWLRFLVIAAPMVLLAAPVLLPRR